MDDEGWWYAQGENRNGPLSAEQLRARVRSGAIGAQALVWRAGMQAWKPVGEVQELADAGMPHGLVLPPAPLARDMDAAGEPAIAAPDSQHPIGPPLVGPWRRYFARTFDTTVFCLLFGFVLSLTAEKFWAAFSLWIAHPGSSFFAGLLLLPLALFFEPLVFGLFETTPGKLLFGIRVSLADGDRPGFIQYLGRMARMYWAGMGLGLPVVSLFTMGQQFMLVRSGRAATYDEGRCEVRGAEPGTWRMVFAGVAIAALIGIVFAVRR